MSLPPPLPPPHHHYYQPHLCGVTLLHGVLFTSLVHATLQWVFDSFLVWEGLGEGRVLLDSLDAAWLFRLWLSFNCDRGVELFRSAWCI